MTFDLTTILALISAISATLSPIIVALINRHSTYKVKAAELFFTTKIEAYNSFLSFTSTFPLAPSVSDVCELNKAASPILLMSKESTQELVSLYSKALSDGISNPTQATAIGNMRAKVILALQSEIAKYEK